MMPRRRALLISAISNTAPEPYNLKIIGSMVLHQANNTINSSPWYTGSNFTMDTDNAVFHLDNASLYSLSYTPEDGFHYQIRGNYCILGSGSGSTMYYFPSESTAVYAFDESTGIYSITAYGKIQVYTPATST